MALFRLQYYAVPHIIFILVSSRNILKMLGQERINSEVKEGQPVAQLSPSKVNPQTFPPKTQQQINHKQNQLEQDKQVDLKTPKRNRSQERNNYLSQKQTPNKASQSLEHSTQNSFKARLKEADRIPEEQQDPDHKNYQDLTIKLQSVLNKISSSKPMKHHQHLSQSLIVRFQECEQRKKKLIDRKKEEYQQRKAKELKEKPTIDKKSDQISKEIGHKPIYLRVDDLVQQKKKKLEKNQQLRKKKLEEEQQNFIEQYNKHVKKPDNVRSYDQYFNEMVRWKEKKAKQNQEKLQIKQSKQLQGITFQPNLNPKSKKMVLSHTRLPIEQRGLIKTKKTYQVKAGVKGEMKGYKKTANL